MDAAAPAVQPSPAMMPTPFAVGKIVKDLSDTFTLELRPHDGRRSCQFAAGQFNMLYMFGVGEVPISISGDPAQADKIVHTIRALGSVTRAMSELRKGALIGVRGPFGSAWPLREAEGGDVVIVAGGIGLAPLRPAILHLLANRGSYGRVTVLYGARTPRDILFRADLRRWSSRLDLTVDVTVDRASGDWHGNVGVVTKLVAHAPFDAEHLTAFVCGPEIMIRYAIQALRDRGVRKPRIYVSMERNMKCALGFCGHCQYGGSFVCRDGPIFSFDRVEHLFGVREI